MAFLSRLFRKPKQDQEVIPAAEPSTPALPPREDISEAKRAKLRRIRDILRTDMPCVETPLHYSFLTEELKQRFNIVDTDNVSCHNYDPIALKIIEDCKDDLVLDCGAGKRAVYYPNVVNFEICPYESTDVLGVGEVLPFRDGVFSAVFSLAVLEHVKDPFACAREIARVMKPGAVLYCVVPFLQPLHGYPHHYYNMTHMGLRNLFADHLDVERQEMIGSGLPIFTLTAFLTSWVHGLQGKTREEFLRMRVADFLGSPVDYLSRPFVTELPQTRNFELASTTALFGRKPQARAA